MRIYGKHRGFVAANDDPKRLRRLKVKVPSLFGDEVLEWAWPCELYGGLGETALVAVPEVGAGVWVEFEAGDPSHPLWVGCWSGAPGGQSEIPAEAQENYPRVKVMKTRSGAYCSVDDTPGEERVKIRSKSGHTMVLDDRPGVEKITVLSKGGHRLELDDAAGAERVVLRSGQGLTATMNDVAFRVEVSDGVNTVTLDKNAGKVTVASSVQTLIAAPLVVLAGGGHPVGLADAIRAAFNSHTHTAPGGSTGTPVEQMTDAIGSAKTFTG